MADLADGRGVITLEAYRSRVSLRCLLPPPATNTSYNPNRSRPSRQPSLYLDLVLTMAITELALVRLKSPDDSSTRSGILAAIEAQAAYSTFPVYLLTQIEDPSYVYIVGGWASTATHMQDWIASEANQRLLTALQDRVEVCWMIHVDIDPVDWKRLPPSAGASRPDAREPDERVPLDAPVLAIGRYFIADGRKEDFGRTFQATKSHLQQFAAPQAVRGGWRIEPQETTAGGATKEEFVLFSGWTDVRQHEDFGESAGFQEFGRIKEALEGAEINHARVWQRTDG
ncbi:uncharacterized protein LDX57_002240 [Aspergillus melleus]|uniref:uncharacterized protein n=1 Tax=Aspergillus melleus TaxID=138277 RepID=UPI001E8D8E26|nr:uncharacterized protein LDX57_002240 [Aspergillus melleus]KAH8424489.1 hypothetical protein LDX57_002240 [Aspergillus melleus]